MNNTITPTILTKGIKYLGKACNKNVLGLRRATCAEEVDKFIKTVEKKKPYVKPEIKVVSVESNSQILASSGCNHDNGNHYGWDNGNHYGWDNGNGNGHGHGRGMEYDDDSFGLDN